MGLKYSIISECAARGNYRYISTSPKGEGLYIFKLECECLCIINESGKHKIGRKSHDSNTNLSPLVNCCQKTLNQAGRNHAWHHIVQRATISTNATIYQTRNVNIEDSHAWKRSNYLEHKLTLPHGLQVQSISGRPPVMWPV